MQNVIVVSLNTQSWIHKSPNASMSQIDYIIINRK